MDLDSLMSISVCRRGPEARFRGRIATDRLREESIRRRSDTGKSRQFQLQPDPRVLAPGMSTHIAAGAEAHSPAARTVLEPDEALQRLVVPQGIHPTDEAVPVAGEGPRAGDFHLLQGATLEAVADVHDLLARPLVLQVHVCALTAGGL